MSSERLTASTGTAKPTPSLPPELDLICWLTPITRPSPSTSGPPELPGLIAASVWIAPEIWKLVSDWIERSIAEMTPTDSDCCSPNGEPIAATGSPTSTLALSPSGSGRSFSPPGSSRSSAMSAFGSSPTILAGDLVAVGELDEDLARAPPRVALAGGHDVRVGGDLALAVEHEPGADAAALAAAERGVERRPRRRSRSRSPRPGASLS